jgi:hypothetical protein
MALSIKTSKRTRSDTHPEKEDILLQVGPSSGIMEIILNLKKNFHSGQGAEKARSKTTTPTGK